MSHTTNEMRDVAGKIARNITERGTPFGCTECVVDDFGRFGNFSLILYLDVKPCSKGYKPKHGINISLGKLVQLIKSVIKDEKESGAIYRSHESPRGVYSQQRIRSFTENYFEGYDKNYIQIDLDFIPYHAPSNTFAVQTEPVIIEQNPRGQQLSFEL